MEERNKNVIEIGLNLKLVDLFNVFSWFDC